MSLNTRDGRRSRGFEIDLYSIFVASTKNKQTRFGRQFPKSNLKPAGRSQSYRSILFWLPLFCLQAALGYGRCWVISRGVFSNTLHRFSQFWSEEYGIDKIEPGLRASAQSRLFELRAIRIRTCLD